MLTLQVLRVRVSTGVNFVQYSISRRGAEALRRGFQGKNREKGTILDIQKFGDALHCLIIGASSCSLSASAPPRELFWTAMN